MKIAKTFFIIMAAGNGRRIGAEYLPKVMYPVAHRPMISYLIDLLARFGAKAREVILVVGFRGEQISEYLGQKKYQFVWQKKRLGTGHAVLQTQRLLKNKKGRAFIMSGDMPFYSLKTIEKMIKIFEREKAILALATAELPEEFKYGRIIKDEKGQVEAIVEEKNAAPEQLKIKEKNCTPYLVELPWLFEALKKVKKNEVSKEYYLTDIVEIAVKEGRKVIAVPLDDWQEAVGINTPENLSFAEKLADKLFF